jgi:hypothetical protein
MNRSWGLITGLSPESPNPLHPAQNPVDKTCNNKQGSLIGVKLLFINLFLQEKGTFSENFGLKRGIIP